MIGVEVGPSTYAHAGGRRRAGSSLAAVAGAAFWCAAAVAQGEEPARILIVYEHDSTLAANIEIARAMDLRLAEGLPGGREIFSEHRDLARFPAPEHADRLAQAMAAKYGGMDIDVVVAAGPGALEFVLDHRAGFAPGAAVVFGGVSQATVDSLAPPPDVVGVISVFDAPGTVTLARRLQPDASRIVVMSGSAEFDASWERRARAELENLVPDLDVSFVSGLSLEGFKAAARALERDAILLLLTIFEDAEGRTFVPREAAAQIAAISGAPAYAVYSSFIGHGVVGGQVETFTAIGEEMAAIALRTLAGDSAQDRAASIARPVVDWRQMRRWGLDGDALPPGTERLFYVPTAWERYRLPILIAAGIILLQAATIIALFVQRARRRRIEAEQAVERLELAHLARVTQLGELSGALAHELNQPLTAILANAQAGTLLIDRDDVDLGELQEILADIVADDQRAAAIIAQLRRLMLKGDAKLDAVDLNQVVAATVALARGELTARQTTVQVRCETAQLIVEGNFAQLQQIVLNLLMNAAEAVANLPQTARRIVVETGIGSDGARELAVIDRGPSIPAETRVSAFKPFFTTKPNGLGFGLSICRTIAQAHRGTLAFDDEAADRTRIVLRLPPG